MEARSCSTELEWPSQNLGERPLGEREGYEARSNRVSQITLARSEKKTLGL